MFEWHAPSREFGFVSTAVSSETIHALGHEEGACENTVVLLRDRKTLLMVLRVDGGDGEPLGRHSPFMATHSNDGRSWAAPWSIAAGSARPRLAVLSSGALLLSGGRPGLGLWVDASGMGHDWQAHSIPQLHNRGAPPEQRFCDEFANHSLSEDTLGWAESTGYTSLLPLGGESALLCYDRTGGGSGGYPAPPLACRPRVPSCAPKKAKDCWSDIFCMQLELSAANGPARSKTDDNHKAYVPSGSLTGNWTANISQPKGVGHIEIWQTGTQLYLRTDDWKGHPSTGTVDIGSMTASVVMFGGAAVTARIENDFNWLVFKDDFAPPPKNCWCKFPHCPMPEPHWRPFP